MTKKPNSKSFFIMGITFTIVSLIWFFWNKNTVIGIVWLAVGILELMIGLILRSKEKQKDQLGTDKSENEFRGGQ